MYCRIVDFSQLLGHVSGAKYWWNSYRQLWPSGSGAYLLRLILSDIDK